jgi:hypothetical protein
MFLSLHPPGTSDTSHEHHRILKSPYQDQPEKQGKIRRHLRLLAGAAVLLLAASPPMFSFSL